MQRVNDSPFRFFTPQSFRPHRRWAVDSFEYLRKLPKEERLWMERFMAEYYDADNDLLRPEKHRAKCRRCQRGKACKDAPPPQALHNTDELRRHVYGLQNAANRDVYSRGAVVLIESVDEGVQRGGLTSRKHANVARLQAGDFTDYFDAEGPATTPAVVRRRKR